MMFVSVEVILKSAFVLKSDVKQSGINFPQSLSHDCLYPVHMYFPDGTFQGGYNDFDSDQSTAIA